ncbi:MAG: hypothetical protein NTV33_09255 [Coprothermobacterota bacterium]|jgi:hypothetical protein|nr:hypothetical protein [Coprothermobacterota bacterium]
MAIQEKSHYAVGITYGTIFNQQNHSSEEITPVPPASSSEQNPLLQAARKYQAIYRDTCKETGDSQADQREHQLKDPPFQTLILPIDLIEKP